MTESSWTNRIVMVTGAAAGIGGGVTELLVGRGAVVVGVDRDEGALAALAEKLSDQPGRLEPQQADVASRTDLERIAATIRADHGGIDGLVCAAGIQRYGTVDGTEPATVEEVLSINVGGAFHAAAAAVPLLRAQGTGAIVLVSSAQAYATQTDVAAYTASKSALLGESVSTQSVPAPSTPRCCAGLLTSSVVIRASKSRLRSGAPPIRSAVSARRTMSPWRSNSCSPTRPPSSPALI